VLESKFDDAPSEWDTFPTFNVLLCLFVRPWKRTSRMAHENVLIQVSDAKKCYVKIEYRGPTIDQP
jgi:hypothetical protein